jgi:hypothetical protein
MLLRDQVAGGMLNFRRIGHLCIRLLTIGLDSSVMRSLRGS